MRRWLAGLVATIAVSFACAAPAPAITNGSPDGNAHPYVGALLADLPDAGGLNAICSGSLMAPTEFLTAGHCVEFLDATGRAPGDVTVTFEPDLRLQNDGTVAPATQFAVTGWAMNPDFRANPAKAYNDVGVIHLAAPVTGVGTVQLPTLGFLDAAKLRGHLFELVGYGYNGVDRSIGSPNATVTWFGMRYRGLSPFSALTPYFLKLQGNAAATGLSGGCFGDSGGPAFWQQGSRLVVAVATAGDPTCGSLNERSRLDTASVLTFLAQFR